MNRPTYAFSRPPKVPLAALAALWAVAEAYVSTPPQLTDYPHDKLPKRTMIYLNARITVDPEQCGGRPCIRGMRIRVTDVLELYAAGLTAKQILDEMPDLEAEDLNACLQYATKRIDHPVLAA